ncbi:MAG: type I-F CRISPR-associated endoribonuclease Cas6/Csy4 [Agitococcus sp.]|nr:type I-F CRISPR-associated endoribonuclease Cas6/Csy4 [Agitococcus sp.]
MKYYQELTLIAQAEVSLYFIWSKVYTQLHLALVAMPTQGNVGVSFPEYVYKEDDGKAFGFLGSKLRLFAHDETTLQQLNINQALSRLSDYVHITGIRPVPKNVTYAIYKRHQPKTNAERLARRRVKHKQDITFEQAVKAYQSKISHTNLPFVQLDSLSNEQRFKLFVSKHTAAEACDDKFGSYGLGILATVPEF